MKREPEVEEICEQCYSGTSDAWDNDTLGLRYLLCNMGFIPYWI